jgi:hypothetical protein
MERYKPLTPSFRKEIDYAINRQIEELKMCDDNVLVRAQISGLQAYKGFIHSLPDGYLIPMKKER